MELAAKCADAISEVLEPSDDKPDCRAIMACAPEALSQDTLLSKAFDTGLRPHA